jgi:hypothetical protein
MDKADVKLSESCVFQLDASRGCDESRSSVFFEFCRATMVNVFASGARVVSCEMTSLPTRPTPRIMLRDKHPAPKEELVHSPMIATLTPVIVVEERQGSSFWPT